MSSKDVLRQKALAAWKFTPSSTSKDQSHGAAWNIVEASQRDMEFVVMALQRELNLGPGADHLLVNTNRIFTEQTSNKNFESDNSGGSNSDEAVPKKLTGKKRNRERGKSPVTLVAADPVHFRTMVQQATGRKISGSATITVVKPQPKRPFLPSPDASRFNSNPYFTPPFSFSGADNSFQSINDLPAWDVGPLYSPGLATGTLGTPSPSSIPSGLDNYRGYLNGEATSASPAIFMDAACIWNRSIFS